MAKIFKSVKPIIPPRNAFNMSFENNLTTEFGRLTPVLMQECVPGDYFRINSQMLIRMAPLYAPTMSRVNCFVRYFFFPDRLTNNDFDTFITGGEDGDGTITARDGSSRVAALPFIRVCDIGELYYNVRPSIAENAFFKKMFGHGSLYDYLGFPAPDWDEAFDVTNFLSVDDTRIDLRPFIVYASVYNEYYRDENFQKLIDIVKDCQGGNLLTYLRQSMNDQAALDLVMDLFVCKVGNWEKDYFTSALPWPQRGEETTIGEEDYQVYGEGHYQAPIDNNKADIDRQQLARGLSVGGSLVASVNEFRRAISIQKFKEASARFGARYFEYIRGFFSTRVHDETLQRPVFLGGSKIPITFGEVLQTSETNITPQGSYAGRGLAGGITKPVKYKVKEFGWIIGILSIVPKPFYFQGLPRKYKRSDKLDFYNPLFANLGEQEISQSELCHTYVGYNGDVTETLIANTMNNKLFGYTPRYAEMRYNPNEVHGDFRNSLLDWHTARILEPAEAVSNGMLTSKFLQIDAQSANRIFNYVSGDFDHFWIDIYHDIRAIRPLPKFGTPSI